MIRRFATAFALLAALAPFANGDDYEIGAGDSVTIQVLGQATLSGDFRVDPDGLIAFPILGKLKVSGHSIAELERKLTTLLADGYLKQPQLTVTIKEYGSQKVVVTGEVVKPGPYPLKADRSLLTFLGDVGTLGPNAGHEVIVIRPPMGGSVLLLPPGGEDPGIPPSDPTAAGLPFDASGSEVFRISLLELQSGHPERNILLQAGDTLYVPKASQVYVTGSVARPGSYRYQEGMTVLQAVTLAGGVTERGSAGRIKLVRLVGGKKQESKAKLTDLVNPEDNVVVPERFF